MLLWHEYKDMLKQGKKEAPLKLENVKAKIAQIIGTAETCGYAHMQAKWKRVLEEILLSVADKRQAAYDMRA